MMNPRFCLLLAVWASFFCSGLASGYDIKASDSPKSTLVCAAHVASEKKGPKEYAPQRERDDSLFEPESPELGIDDQPQAYAFFAIATFLGACVLLVMLVAFFTRRRRC